MVESTNSTADWASTSLTNLVAEVEKAREEGKYCFLWDKNGNVPMFFGYKGQLCDIQPKLVGKAIGKFTDADVAEYIRSQLVIGQRSGGNVLIAIGKLNPTWWRIHTAGVFEPELTFNRTEWLKQENYIKFVKEEENHSIGGLNPGMYHLVEDSFSLTICTQAATEEDVIAQLANLPHADQFKKVIIT